MQPAMERSEKPGFFALLAPCIPQCHGERSEAISYSWRLIEIASLHCVPLAMTDQVIANEAKRNEAISAPCGNTALRARE